MTSKNSKKNISQSANNSPNLGLHLHDDKFGLFIKNIFYELNSFECIPLDLRGGMFFLTSDGIPSILVIRAQYDLYQMVNHIKRVAPHFPKDLIQDIKTGKKILFTEQFESDVPADELPKHLYEGHKLKLDVPYKLYYAIIRENIPGIDNSEIVSYEDYLKSINAKAPSGNTH